MRRAIALVALALAGCDDTQKVWSKNDIREIVDERAQHVDTTDLEARIAALEQQVAEQKQQLAEYRAEQFKNHGSYLDSRKRDLDRESSMARDIDALYKNDAMFRRNVNWLLAHHGGQQIAGSD